MVTPFDLTLKSYQHTKLLELGIEPVIYRMRVSDIETTILWAVVWLSWNSGRFQFQRSAVQIQSSTKINIEHLLSTVLKRRKKRKIGREWPIILKTTIFTDELYCQCKARIGSKDPFEDSKAFYVDEESNGALKGFRHSC